MSAPSADALPWPAGDAADPAGPALGLSIGATTLAAATADRAVTRTPVLTLHPERPAEVGLPSENPRLDRPGLVVSGFVDRVAGRVVAPDGSAYRGEALLADALRALAYAATGGHALPDDVVVTYPAHWEAPVVDALGAALGGLPEFSDRERPLLLIADAAAALLAVRADSGLPRGGTVAVCDFGGSGTNITLMDAAGGQHALAPTVRHEFCGHLIDQLLVTLVLANLPATGPPIGALSRLRAGCRNAKERLSSDTVTDGPRGMRGAVRLTRNELDDVIRAPLNDFLTVLDNCLARNGIRDLAAVVAVGGGANIPAVAIALSRRCRVPVFTTPRPQLAAALGAALRSAHTVGR